MLTRPLRKKINWLFRIILLASLTLPVAGTGARSVEPAFSLEPLDVIVQARDSATAAAQVQDTGGTVTHMLGIINAVGALLTPMQLAQLNGTAGLRVYNNHTLQVAVEGISETVRDQFDVRLYSNNDGTMSWSGDWIKKPAMTANLMGEK